MAGQGANPRKFTRFPRAAGAAPPMSTDWLAAEPAIALIEERAKAGVRVLGVDGIEIVNGTAMGRIDLCLDLSTSPMSLEEAARRARAFVTGHAAPQIVFDVVLDD